VCATQAAGQLGQSLRRVNRLSAAVCLSLLEPAWHAPDRFGPGRMTAIRVRSHAPCRPIVKFATRLAKSTKCSRLYNSPCTGSKRRFGTIWCGLASVTASGGSGGAERGCMATSDCSMTTGSPTDSREAAASHTGQPHNPWREAVQERVVR
jgi:hypothetical protein